MKIGIFADALQVKKGFGISSFLKNLLKHLPNENVVLLLLKGLKYYWKKDVKLKFYGSGLTKPKMLKIINKILAHNQISRENFDLLFWPHQQIYFLKKPKPKFIFVVHDVIPLLFPHWHSKFTVYFDYKLMLKKVGKYAEKIVCVSSTTKNDFIRFFGKAFKEKTILIYNGIDHKKFYPRKKKEIKKVKEKFGIEKEYIFYSGGFHPRKNVETLLKAFDILREEYEIELVLTGEGIGVFKNFDTTYYSLKHKKDVKILGFVEEKYLPALYSGAIFFVNPSLYEGFGFCALEAIACNTPVIVSDIPVSHELLPYAEKFSPNSVNELVGKMKGLLNDKKKRKKIVIKNKKIVRKLSWEKTAKNYEKLFESVIND